METQSKRPRIFSCEFFPPVDDKGVTNLRHTRKRLIALSPAFFSVTYGAAGSTRNRTFQTVLEIQHHDSTVAAPHLTCIGSTKASIRAILELYIENGIRRIVALRGDLPAGMQSPGEFRHANELVEFIREQTGDHFHIEVAAYPEFHPQASNSNRDLLSFKRKADAGADGAITQYFYNPYAYSRFIDDCESLGLDLPIVPGIMPITNYRQLARFSNMCGAEIPRWIGSRLESYGDDLQAIRSFGEDVVTELCQTLLDWGAPGLHFYTMNRSAPTLTIARNIGLIS